MGGMWSRNAGDFTLRLPTHVYSFSIDWLVYYLLQDWVEEVALQVVAQKKALPQLQPTFLFGPLYSRGEDK